MIRTGIDLVEIERVKKAIERTGESFLKRVYTENERVYCEKSGRHRFESYAGKFAAKEAFSKALGTGISGGVAFNEIEILNDERGKPYVVLHGNTLVKCSEILPDIANEGMISEIDVSITHTSETAAAIVVIESERKYY